MKEISENLLNATCDRTWCLSNDAQNIVSTIISYFREKTGK